MSVEYNRVNWQQAPSEATPINARNLNNMDKGIDDVVALANANKKGIEELKTTAKQINSNLDNYVVVKNLKPKSDVTINVDMDIPIKFDGYICERINYSAQTGYSIFYIKNENKEVIFTHQMNCGTNIGYAHDGCFVPVKKGWYLRVEGQSIQAAQYKFTHI